MKLTVDPLLNWFDMDIKWFPVESWSCFSVNLSSGRAVTMSFPDHLFRFPNTPWTSWKNKLQQLIEKHFLFCLLDDVVFELIIHHRESRTLVSLHDFFNQKSNYTAVWSPCRWAAERCLSSGTFIHADGASAETCSGFLLECQNQLFTTFACKNTKHKYGQGTAGRDGRWWNIRWTLVPAVVN